MTTEDALATDDRPTVANAVGRLAFVAGMASIAAGAVHAAAAGSHGDERALAWLFASCAVVQVGWGAAVLFRPARRVLIAGAAFSMLCVGFWALTRATGVGFSGLEEAQDVTWQDATAAALAAVAIAAAIAALRPVGRGVRLVTAPAVLVSVVLLAIGAAVPAIALPHDHSHGSDEDRAEAHAAAADDHHHGSAGAEGHESANPVEGDVVDPSSSHAHPYQEIPSAAQLSEALQLIDATAPAIARYADYRVAEADGYVSIHDQELSGGFEHYIRTSYLFDDYEVDPAHTESLVYQWGADGAKTLISAMFILSVGDTMADVPDIAGSLTPWHDHNDLCWENGMLVGFLENGVCTAGTFAPTPPMLHVWVVDNPCGPFAGIDRHGGICKQK